MANERNESCNTILNVLEREYQGANKLASDCNTQTLHAMHTFDIDLERNRDKCSDRRFDMLLDKSFELRQDFINNCVCNKVINR